MEFGLRRAQGPDGAMSASKYSCIGGFDATSNVLAGKIFGLVISGTHAHSYVMSYRGLDGFREDRNVGETQYSEKEFVNIVLQKKHFFCVEKKHLFYDFVPEIENANIGELAAFISYAIAFPKGFLALVDTYSTLTSGVPNFIFVGAALKELGFKAVGIRIDSGNLAQLSKDTRKLFKEADRLLGEGEFFGPMRIVASNDINEEILWELNRNQHEINSFGIGTEVITKFSLYLLFYFHATLSRPYPTLLSFLCKCRIHACVFVCQLSHMCLYTVHISLNS